MILLQVDMIANPAMDSCRIKDRPGFLFYCVRYNFLLAEHSLSALSGIILIAKA